MIQQRFIIEMNLKGSSKKLWLNLDFILFSFSFTFTGKVDQVDQWEEKNPTEYVYPLNKFKSVLSICLIGT